LANRYYLPELGSRTGECVLVGPEAHHLLVHRERAGSRVELFNGRGLRAQAVVAGVHKNRVTLTLESFEPISIQPRSFDLACAVPKGDRARLLVEKCTELGVRRLILLRTDRSVSEARVGKLERLHRTVIEACKQCGRDWLMEVSGLVAWDTLVETSPPGWMLHPKAEHELLDMRGVPTVAAIGPEGGWTDRELSVARDHGWMVFRLPGHVLRTETAAMALAVWGSLR
jgi:16S rRNA (uracil1498-N3)-methyltransferase